MCAWQFSDSFDCYTALTDPTNGYWDVGVGGSAYAWATGRFAGSQALQSNTNAVYLAKTSGVNDAVHHLTCAFLQVAAISGTTLGMYLELFDGATAQCTVVFRSDGAILLVSGGPTGTTLATYTGAVLAINTWYAFEMEIVINNTTGRFRVRKNGNTVDDFDSGAVLNTRPGANSYANKSVS